MMFDGPKEDVLSAIGRVGSSSARLTDMKSRLQKQLVDKCSNPGCSNAAAPNTKLSVCASCNSVSYCCRDCQVAHWPEHKAQCKEIKAKLKEKEVETAKLAAEALEQLDGLHLKAAEESSTTTNNAAATASDSDCVDAEACDIIDEEEGEIQQESESKPPADEVSASVEID
jgi:hypothetical protein